MGPEVNPFWSQRLQEQVAVQQARPIDLPVPSEAEDLEALTVEQSMPMEQQDVPRTVRRTGDQLGKGRGERFSTPASWNEDNGRQAQDLREGHRSEGMMPPEEVEPSVQVNTPVREKMNYRGL